MRWNRHVRASITTALTATAFGLMIAPGSLGAPPSRGDHKMTQSAYDFGGRTIEGEESPLSAYRGKVSLIVNTASRCGFTPQYASLEKLYRRYRDRGFEVLAFPANNFLRQEPGSNEEIKSFCTLRYQTSFPLFSKISVKGKDIAPLYSFLTTKSPFPGAIGWNFTKFLVARDGRVIARFDSATDPLDRRVTDALERALAEKPEAREDRGTP
jgi:glutathione peroxidase